VDNASRQVGQIAATALVEQIAAPRGPGGLELVAPSLVVRGTTGAPPTA
jgi:DNA-binding LacI/PurR family transcriptional regulator